MKHIYFVRHGESNSNVDGIRRDGENTILTESGHQQANVVAKRLKRMSIDVVLTSPYKRAHDTGKTIAKVADVPLEVIGLAKERVLPKEIYGKSRHDAKSVQLVEEVEHGWLTGDIKHPSTEDFSEIVERADKLRKIISERSEDHIVVTSHGFFSKMFVYRFLLGDLLTAKLSLEMVAKMPTSNTGITHYTIDGGGKWALINWNDDAHLGELV